VTLLSERAITIESEGLQLEGALHEAEAPRLAAVVLHPHPQYGGDMDNLVVVEVCGALAAAGATTLRFNFRGTGRSDGKYDGGRGERIDALSAVATAHERAPGAPLVLAGYSFGAAVAVAALPEATADGLVLISPPLAYSTPPELPADVDIVLITGDLDQVAPAERVRALEGGRVRAVVAPGVDHSWWSGAEVLRREVTEFAEAMIALSPRQRSSI